MSKVGPAYRVLNKECRVFQSPARSLAAAQKLLPCASLLEDTYSSKDLDAPVSKNQTHCP